KDGEQGIFVYDLDLQKVTNKHEFSYESKHGKLLPNEQDN
ncbi:peptidase, partial [Staphylococcus condimenti]